MPQILGEIGHDAADLPNHSMLVKRFVRIKTALWRVLLRLSAQLYEPSGHAAIDATTAGILADEQLRRIFENISAIPSAWRPRTNAGIPTGGYPRSSVPGYTTGFGG